MVGKSRTCLLRTAVIYPPLFRPFRWFTIRGSARSFGMSSPRELMDALHVTLYVHIMALVVAACAATVVKLAIGRLKRARTVAEALDWHNVMTSTSKLFPI